MGASFVRRALDERGSARVLGAAAVCMGTRHRIGNVAEFNGRGQAGAVGARFRGSGNGVGTVLEHLKSKDVKPDRYALAAECAIIAPMVDSPYLPKPGKKVRLSDYATDDTGAFKDKLEAQAPTQENLKRLAKLQEVLYAQGKYALLVVFQAMDGGGKDGAIEHVFSGVNPQGCQVTSFKAPTPLELSHDFLWRIHNAAPARGMIGIFNRSHYESVLVERVKDLVPEKVWSRRYDHINNFEKLLADEGTTIL